MFSRPDAGRQPVRRVVGQRNRLLRGPEGHRNQHRTEDLHLGDGGGGSDIGEEGRREEIALGWAGPGWLPHLCALLDALRHQSLDPLQLDGRDDGADVDRFVERIADAQRLHPFAQSGNETFFHAFLHQQTGAGAADLALIEPDGIDHALDHAIEIGILEDDERRFAAKLERKSLPRAGGSLPDQTARPRLTR